MLDIEAYNASGQDEKGNDGDVEDTHVEGMRINMLRKRELLLDMRC